MSGLTPFEVVELTYAVSNVSPPFLSMFLGVVR
jgi:hypothetical protein